MCRIREFVEGLITKGDYFHQPHLVEPNPVDPRSSYYYDLRDRAKYPGGFVDGMPMIRLNGREYAHPLGASQCGIGMLQLYWDTGDSRFLSEAAGLADALIRQAGVEGDCIVWRRSTSTPDGDVNWISAMDQGQAASFLMRVGHVVGSNMFLDRARRALNPFFVDIAAGGVLSRLGEFMWFEDSVRRPRFVLNHFIVALLSLRDAGLLLGDTSLNRMYEDAVEGLSRVLELFDRHGWSLYDLFFKVIAGVSVGNLASPFYHRFHIELLRVLEIVTNLEQFTDQRMRWEETLSSGTRLYGAILEKVLYRALTPVQRASI